MVWPCDQNTPGEMAETGPAGYTQEKAVQRSTKDQVALLHLWPCLSRLGMEPAELSEIAECC